MRVLFDCSNITIGGGIQVANSFLKYAFKSIEIQYFYLLSKNVYDSIEESDTLDYLNIHVVITNHYTLLPSHRSIQKIREIEKQFQPDITFSLFGPAYWKSKVPHIVGFARPHYILHNSPFYKVKKNRKLIRYMYFLEAIHNYLFRKNSDYLFVENESMVNALNRKYEKMVYYVPNTYNQIFEDYRPKSNESSGPIFRLLTVSSDYPHKNLDTIPSVAAILIKKYPAFKFQFVVTVSELNKKVSNNYIQYIGPVKIEDCPKLYFESDVMYLPTLLECFSASYVEAMFMKLPILTSDLSFARSICGEAAVYFDPLNDENIADKIYDLATNVNHQKKLVDLGSERLSLFGTPKERYNRFVNLFHKIKKD